MRFRTMALAGILALGGLAIAMSSARAQCGGGGGGYYRSGGYGGGHTFGKATAGATAAGEAVPAAG